MELSIGLSEYYREMLIPWYLSILCNVDVQDVGIYAIAQGVESQRALTPLGTLPCSSVYS